MTWTAGSAGEGALSWRRACLAASLVPAGVMGLIGRLQGGNVQDREILISVPAGAGEALKAWLLPAQQHEAEVSNAAALGVPSRCKPNIIGRQCDLCAPGFYHYPNCWRCDCHQAGTEASVCDPVTGQCHCKVSPLMPSRGVFLLGSTLLLWQYSWFSLGKAVGVWHGGREQSLRRRMPVC